MTLSAKQISSFVDQNKEEAIRCLQEILQVPSVTGEEEAVSHVFEKWMTATDYLSKGFMVLPTDRIYCPNGKVLKREKDLFSTGIWTFFHPTRRTLENTVHGLGLSPTDISTAEVLPT